jgi:hypothetical protein
MVKSPQDAGSIPAASIFKRLLSKPESSLFLCNNGTYDLTFGLAESSPWLYIVDFQGA